MQIKFTPNALSDIYAIREYITVQVSSELAQKVLNQIELMIRKLPYHAEMGRLGRVKGTRELVIPKQPYIVSYQVRDKMIQIIAIIHQRRRWL